MAILPADVAAQIRNAADSATARHREVLVSKMEDAAAAYERGRYPEAARLAKQVADEAPAVAAVRELAGLAAYRSGRWREAIRHLNAFTALGDSSAHVPALMDSHRALGQRGRVADLWSELRRQSPGPDVLAEARIVAAGSLADQGDLRGAIAVLATGGAAKALRNPAGRHLRQWYALADLYERAGDLPRARELFSRVLRAEPDAYDAAERLEGLGPDRSRRSRRPAPRRPKSDSPETGSSPRPASVRRSARTAGERRDAAPSESVGSPTGTPAPREVVAGPREVVAGPREVVAGPREMVDPQ